MVDGEGLTPRGIARGEPDPGSSRARPRDPRVRRRGVVGALAVMLVAVAAGVGVLAWGDRVAPSAAATSAAATSQASEPVVEGPGYLTSYAELRQRAALASQGVEPYRSAVQDLLVFARAGLAQRPHPEEPLDIPGTTGPFVDDTATAYGLALAYAVTGDLAYARQAAAFILAWVNGTHSLVRACPDSGACQTSLILSRTAPGFVFAADLLGPSGVMSPADSTAFKGWLRDLVLPNASRLDNNWGDAGTFTRVVVSDYLGDGPAFAAAIDKWRAQTDLIAADGHIPLEVRRGHTGLSYTQEALDYKIAVAEIASRRGLDLWDYRGAGGATLRTAVDYLARYWPDAAAWPWYPDPTVPSPSGMWEIAFEHWRDPAYQPIIELRRPYGWQGHSAIRWTTLTNGLPFDATGSVTSTP